MILAKTAAITPISKIMLGISLVLAPAVVVGLQGLLLPHQVRPELLIAQRKK
jgi:hypothetical protein